jgi:hypothetical protein
MANTLLLRDTQYLANPGNKVQFLGRMIVRREGGYDLSVNRGLAEEIVNDAGVLGRRACPVPGHKEPRKDVTPVSIADHAYYRTQVGRLIFYVQYRADMQYAVGQLSRKVSAPEAWNMMALKRVIKYLALTMDWVLELRPTRGALNLYGHCDADWAGLDDRKSVSCGICYLNGSCFLSYSRTQVSRALSSCESELYALGSIAPELLRVKGILQECFGETVTPTAFSDSSSALTVSSRVGMGQLKHVELRLLTIQDWVAEKRLALGKIGTLENTADVGTKFLAGPRTRELSEAIGIR